MYQLPNSGFDGVITADGRWIPRADENRDWMRYQEWLKEGNEPADAEPVPDKRVDPVVSKASLLAEVDALKKKIESLP